MAGDVTLNESVAFCASTEVLSFAQDASITIAAIANKSFFI
jgi:hypothetical protein